MKNEKSTSEKKRSHVEKKVYNQKEEGSLLDTVVGCFNHIFLEHVANEVPMKTMKREKIVRFFSYVRPNSSQRIY